MRDRPRRTPGGRVLRRRARRFRFAAFVNPPSPPDSQPPRRILCALGLLLAVLWLGVLGWRDLVPTDEGRYAEIPREMVVSGDWVTPRLDGFKYFEKPPLQYWATAAAYQAFGFGAWQARLWTGLCGLLTILFTGYAGARLYDRRTGVYAAAVLASCVYWVGLGHINTLDMGVSATLAGSLFAFLLAQRDAASARQRLGWMLVCWAMMGLAMLSKGLIGPAFPGVTLLLYTLLRRDWKLWTRLHFGPGLLVFAAIALPWHLWVQARNPEFFDFYFIYQQFTRFLTPALARPGPWYYFIPILVLGLLPWLGGLPAGIRRAAREHAAGLRPGWVLLIWSGFIFLFFSASHSKLPSYILPMFPALALLVGAGYAQAPPRALRRQFLVVALLCLLALPALTQLGRAGNALTPAAAYRDYALWLAGAALLGAGGGLLAWKWESTGRRSAALLLLATAMCAGLTLATQGFQVLGRVASTRDVAAAIAPWRQPGQPFYSIGTYDQTLPFYLNREVTVVAYQGELEFGMRQRAQGWLPTLQDFARQWRAERLPLAFVPVEQWSQLQALRLPLLVIERTPRYVVVARPDQDYGAAARAAQARLPAAWNAPLLPQGNP
jgi:4-amino-4-deoxy-L-arabinose transferase-like glycosyltransferase